MKKLKSLLVMFVLSFVVNAQEGTNIDNFELVMNNPKLSQIIQHCLSDFEESFKSNWKTNTSCKGICTYTEQRTLDMGIF